VHAFILDNIKLWPGAHGRFKWFKKMVKQTRDIDMNTEL